jgi:Uma2 family endonuclease
MTAEEFFRSPPQEGSLQELVRGVVVTQPLPGARHGLCCCRIGRRLANFADEKGLGIVACFGTGFVSERGPDTVLAPDVALWRREHLPEVPEGYSDIPPDLAVEVVSHLDPYSQVQGKVRHYLSHGVRMVWVVDPQERSMAVYRSLRPGTILDESATVSGADVLPGFTCQVADLLP